MKIMKIWKFSANLTENNEIQEIYFKKDRRHLLTGLKINQKSEIIELNKVSDGLLLNKIEALADKDFK